MIFCLLAILISLAYYTEVSLRALKEDLKHLRFDFERNQAPVESRPSDDSVSTFEYQKHIQLLNQEISRLRSQIGA